MRHKSRRAIPKRNTGPKGQFGLWTRDAALEGPLFHGIIGGVARPDETVGVGGVKPVSAPHAVKCMPCCACSDVEERRFSAASRRRNITESRRDDRNPARVRNETNRQDRYPPLAENRGRAALQGRVKASPQNNRASAHREARSRGLSPASTGKNPRRLRRRGRAALQRRVKAEKYNRVL